MADITMSFSATSGLAGTPSRTDIAVFPESTSDDQILYEYYHLSSDAEKTVNNVVIEGKNVSTTFYTESYTLVTSSDETATQSTPGSIGPDDTNEMDVKETDLLTFLFTYEDKKYVYSFDFEAGKSPTEYLNLSGFDPSQSTELIEVMDLVKTALESENVGGGVILMEGSSGSTDSEELVLD